MTSICKGTGECLTQTGENTYEKSEEYTCAHNCNPIPCCNEIVCGTQLPPWFHGLKHAGICICIDCDMKFSKKLGIVESADCPVCLETKLSVVMPNCTHTMCVGCFKRCMYGPPDGPDEPEPEFPYPDDVYDEYSSIGRDAHRERIMFLKRYPLISKWDRDWNQWQDKREEKYEKEENLRHCPYCRA